MSLNISGSRFVKVYDPTIKLNYSDKVLFANLVTSRKTGNAKIDKTTGEVVRDSETGKEVQERAFSRWEGKFVGNAFEPSKTLRDGDMIDIVNGWVTAEPFTGKDGKPHISLMVTIAEFEPSIIDGEDANVDDE
mgnify:CR=1 FL=1